MHERLLRNLKEQRDNKIHYLKSGSAKDYTEYKSWCTEITVLERCIEQISAAIDEDDE